MMIVVKRRRIVDLLEVHLREYCIVDCIRILNGLGIRTLNGLEWDSSMVIEVEGGH
jgi:hypothetical protein